MSVPIDEFWKLTLDSQLLPVERYRELRVRFRHLRGAYAGANSRALATWLVNQQVLTPYQAHVLLSGRSGPFTFGDYRVCNRLPGPLGARRFDGVHLPTNHQLLLHFWPRGHGHWSTAQAAAQCHIALTHPHLDRCYETVEAAGQRIAVAENVEGVPVAESTKVKPLPATEAIQIAYQVAVALQQMHNAGLVHGFVTPDDILVGGSGHAKLRRFPITLPAPIDFDVPDPKQRLLRQADYLAPELRRSDQPPNALADIYALGCTLYEMLKGQQPFPGGSLSEKMERHASEPIASLDQVAAIPAGLTEVISFMMAKKPSLRYQSAAEVAQIEAFLGSAAHVSPPRPRATEPYYLAHIHKKSRRIPTHLLESTELETAGHETAGLESTTQQAAPPVKQPQVSPPVTPTGPAPVTPHSVTPHSVTPHSSAGSTVTGDSPPKVGVETVNVSGNRMRSRRPITVLSLGSAAIALIIALVVIVIIFSQDQRDVAPPPSQPDSSADRRSPPGSDPGIDRGTSSENATSETVADDGQTLWVSPTGGKPISLDYAPPSSQCFLHVRPQSIVQSLEGPAVLKALGPRFEAIQRQLAERLGLSLEQIESLLVALVPQDTEPPRPTLVLRLADREFVSRLESKADSIEQLDSGRQLAFDQFAAYLPTNSPAIVIGSQQDIQEVINQAGRPPLLKRQIEELRAMTDEDRHLTIILDPHFLAADGRDMFAGEFAQLRSPTLSFLGDQTQAICISVHFDTTFYGELLLCATLDQDPYSLAAACKERLQELPETVNSKLGRIVIERFWQPVAVRFPLMINYLHEQTRIGVVNRCAMVNVAMPRHSAHNLILASVLAVEASAISDGDIGAAPEPESLDWNSILAHRIDLEIPQQSLEFTMVELAIAVNQALPQAGFQIVIIGADLQLDGITRNQQIRNVNLKNQSVSQILTELVRRANPTPADSITSPDQKLVWVSAPESEASGKTVFITRHAQPPPEKVIHCQGNSWKIRSDHD